MAPSGISLNKPATITILVLVVGGIILYRWGWSSSSSASGQTGIVDAGKGDVGKPNADTKVDDESGKIMDVTKLPDIPLSVIEKSKSVIVKEEFLNVEMKDKVVKVYSQKTSPEGTPKLTVLLLHGQAFSSKNWVEIKTVHLLAALGYSAVAVDLPGFGQSNTADVKHEEFMVALVQTLEAKVPPVIVSPSMSGKFSLPYLFSEPASSTSRASAFIPVAPISTGSFTKQYLASQLPTLIVHGSNDVPLGKQSTSDLKVLPKSTIAVIPDAGHACYIDKPDMFHRALQKFLGDVAEH